MKFRQLMSGKKFIVPQEEVVVDNAQIMIKLIGRVSQKVGKMEKISSAVIESSGQLAFIDDDTEVIKLT